MRPRELVLRDLSGRVKQEDSGDQFGGPGHTFSFSLEKEYFFSNFFLQYSCSHVTLNESCTFSPSTFIGVSVWKQRETTKMINSFFNRKIKIPHSLLQVLVPPHPPVRVCFLVHKRVFFFPSQDRCWVFHDFHSSLFPSGGEGGGLLFYCMAFTGMCRWTGYGFCHLLPKQGI